VRYNTAQEQATTNWSASTVAPCVKVAYDSSPKPQGSLRFTAWSLLGGRGYHFQASYPSITTPFVFQDCQFGPGSLEALQCAMAVTNCLLERVSVNLDDDGGDYDYYGYNNLFHAGSLTVGQYDSSSAWQFKDNLFDQTTISQSGTITHDYNGYVTNKNRLSPNGAHDVILTNNPVYQTSSLGNYYYPTNDGMLSRLIDAGSCWATNAGLYHFTTTTNQVKEGNTTNDIGFHYVAVDTNGLPVDTDGDGLPDYFEDRNGNGNYDSGTDLSDWQNAYTFTNGLNDLQNYELTFNVLVNDPMKDYGNEQNTQFESTCAVLNGNIIVAYVDSNQGVYALGADLRLTNYTPQFVAYSVSVDGGVTFQDKGVPPLARAGDPTNDDGDAGNPVLAVDRASSIVYLAGTSPRNAGTNGIPLWKSTDGGLTFGTPIIVREDITTSDKPWVAVDNGPGTGQHDVYLTCTSLATNKLWLTVSTNGLLDNWSDPVAVRETGVSNITLLQSAIPVVAPDHVAYVFWLERMSVGADGTNWLRMRQVRNRGATTGEVYTICQLVTTNATSGNLALKRSNTAAEDDTFREHPFPVPAVNPDTNKLGHLYVVYSDRGTNANDKADVFFVRSADAGTNWTAPLRVSTDQTTNDQWMPMLAVKPDGTALFAAWFDRRNDTNNSLIEVYGRFATVAAGGTVTFATNDFRITTTDFPPVFPGTLTSNTNHGHYDPVYPPGRVNLQWYYPEWYDEPRKRPDTYAGHLGDYNGAFADGRYVFITWMDNRLKSAGTLYDRNQSDIRMVKLTWP
jgi:hypothetical protein